MDVFDSNGLMVGKLIGTAPFTTYYVWFAGDDVIWPLDSTSGTVTSITSQTFVYGEATCTTHLVETGGPGWGVFAKDSLRGPPIRPYAARGLPKPYDNFWILTDTGCLNQQRSGQAYAVTDLGGIPAHLAPLAVRPSGVPALR